jgi:hypothetical protein
MIHTVRTRLLLLAQASVALGVLLLTLGLTVHLGGPWSAGYGIGLLSAWGILSVPLHHTKKRTP